MASEYVRVHDYYMQPAVPVHYQHQYMLYDLPQPSAGAAAAYEVTTAEDAAAETAGAHLGHGLHTLRPKPPSIYSSDGFELATCEGSLPPPGPVLPASATRKRKPSSFGVCSSYDDDGNESSRSPRTMPDKKQNHSEIEKRRRDKMNTYISELSAMVPMCGAMARKLDKLTVLRMAVQHLRSVRGAIAAPLSVQPRPAYLSERELNSLVLQAAHDCFLLVVGCDRGRLLYVSASVKKILHYEQSELLGQSLFDILHPKDVAKVKEQLSSSDLSPRERLIDAKTMLPVKAEVVCGASRLCPGARRSFFCRIKSRSPKEEPISSAASVASAGSGSSTSNARKKQVDKKYCVIQCTGYLKSWAASELGEAAAGLAGNGGDGQEEGSSVSCLVAVGTAPLPPPSPPPQRRHNYASRHATDGKFLFVDQRVTVALGFLPQELLGTSLYEYVGGGGCARASVARAHMLALLRRTPHRTPPYAHRTKDGGYATLITLFKPFRNPWTKDVECLVANNILVTEGEAPEMAEELDLDPDEEFDVFKHDDVEASNGGTEADMEMQRLIESQLESHKIGHSIAEAARRDIDPEPDLSLDFTTQGLSNPLTYDQSSIVDNILGVDDNYEVRNNVPLSAASAHSPPTIVQNVGGESDGNSSPAPNSMDGNGEAAMAVIMSLLEADAGLGGPVNFAGLPWPLP
ncbi:hypothetical protein ACJJTC_017856 [Scirpophaga incertulas]